MRTAKAALVIALLIVIVFLATGRIAKTGHIVGGIPGEEFFNYTIHFCAWEDCGRVLSSALNGAHSVKCAFYRADGYIFGNASHSAAADFVLDEKAKVPVAAANVNIYRADSRGIMHSKYCILDNRSVITGSFNPTKAAANDYNNLIVINSSSLAEFYSENFEFLVRPQHQHHQRKKSVMLNNTMIEVYFCPYDDCITAVKAEIARARTSIVFAAYSFTHPEIANELILKAAENVSVSGILEKSTTGSSYSKDNVLAANGVNLRLEAFKRLMHHKFFVIDNETVITGSFNPTRNAAERNDENLMIIHNKEVALEYAEEFNMIYGAQNVQE